MRSQAGFRHLLGISVLSATLAMGCSGIGVRPNDSAHPEDTYQQNALQGDRLSPRTLQTLRQLDLERLYPGRMAEISGELHAQMLSQPNPDKLFALAEVNFVRGVRADRKASPDACTYYYLAAGYAYHFLFPVASRAPGELPGFLQSNEPPRPFANPSNREFDPQFRLACDIYNQGLSRCLQRSQEGGRLDSRGQIHIPSPDRSGTISLKIRHHGFRYQSEEFGKIQPCSDFEVVGLANHHRKYGLGVPLVVTRDSQLPLATEATYPPGVSFPATAFFRFEGSLADLAEHRAGILELHNPLKSQTIQVGRETVPLECDLTTPLAYYLGGTTLNTAGFKAFLHPDAVRAQEGLHTLEPFESGKIPVVLIHGLFGTPITWAPLYNDLRADPEIRRNYQFWVYYYPTGNPYLASAAKLREELQKLAKKLDPEGKDASLRNMVVVGHSMGGLISRLLTIQGGDDFWNVVSTEPLERLRLADHSREELRRIFYFERQPGVSRVIYLGTPHHGSKLSPSLIGRVGAWLAGLPHDLADISRDIMEDNPQVASSFKEKRITSVDLLAPESPALQLIAHRPLPEGIRNHSVIGVTSRNQMIVERLFGGGYRQPSDGVVPYASAHLESADSELVVPADHYHVHQHPLAIQEVRRILLEHLKTTSPEKSPIQPVRGDIPTTSPPPGRTSF